MKNRLRQITLSLAITAFVLGGTAWAQMAPGKVSGILYGSPETFAEFHGFMSLLYSDFEKDGKTADANAGDSTFDQHYFYFNAIAKIRQNVTVFGEVEYEHGGEELSLDRAFIDWGLKGEQLNLRLGKFYSPFGLEIREYQYPVRKMSSRPMMTRNLLFNEWTETGVNLYGRVGTPVAAIDYDIAVVNGPNGDDTDTPADIPDILEVGTSRNPNVGGTGDAKQNRDNNSDRTLIGRVSANFPMTVVGLSYAVGNYADSSAVENDLTFSLMGLDANFRMKGLDIRGEWAARTADVDPALVGTIIPIVIPDDEMKSSSYYLQASYKVSFNKEGLHYIEPVIRYDYLEPDDDVDNDERTRTTIGVNYSPYPHFKFMAEWQMNEGPDSAATEPKDDGFMVSATVDF